MTRLDSLHDAALLEAQLAVDLADIRVLLDGLGHPITDDDLLTLGAMSDVRDLLDGGMCERSVWWANRDHSLDDELFYQEMLDEGIDVRPSRPGTAAGAPSGEGQVARAVAETDEHRDAR